MDKAEFALSFPFFEERRLPSICRNRSSALLSEIQGLTLAISPIYCYGIGLSLPLTVIGSLLEFSPILLRYFISGPPSLHFFSAQLSSFIEAVKRSREDPADDCHLFNSSLCDCVRTPDESQLTQSHSCVIPSALIHKVCHDNVVLSSLSSSFPPPSQTANEVNHNCFSPDPFTPTADVTSRFVLRGRVLGGGAGAAADCSIFREPGVQRGNFTLAELGVCEPTPPPHSAAVPYCPDLGLLQRGYSLSAGSDADSDPEGPLSPERAIQLWAGQGRVKSRRSSGVSSRENSALTLTDSENDNKSDDESAYLDDGEDEDPFGDYQTFELEINWIGLIGRGAEVCGDIEFSVHVLHDNKAQCDGGNSRDSADGSQTEFSVRKLAAIVSQRKILRDK
ncbi:hypothetical protein FQN60_009840 [Etheostoma spectabile]|uniref:Teneurin N-terminal domain-containing protein n=1 Tax=Etheostoma spectabile TaxID=54343 RepID=A0A5J5D7D2_9PERO|nr:hypothetical protein FQN60_009840 [Etheostoma spectabile]